MVALPARDQHIEARNCPLQWNDFSDLTATIRIACMEIVRLVFQAEMAGVGTDGSDICQAQLIDQARSIEERFPKMLSGIEKHDWGGQVRLSNHVKENGGFRSE